LRPRLAARLSWRRHGKPAPDLLSSLRVEPDDLPAPAVVSAQADRDDAACIHGRCRDDLSFVARFVADVLIPDELAGGLAERDDAGVRQPGKPQTLGDDAPFAVRRAHRHSTIAPAPGSATATPASAATAATGLELPDGVARPCVDLV